MGANMGLCGRCKHLFCDSSVGYYECLCTENMTDEEYDAYCEQSDPEYCRFFEEWEEE